MSQDTTIVECTDAQPRFSHREERREHMKTALQFFEFLTDSEEHGTFQVNERSHALETSIWSRIELLSREIREELARDEANLPNMSEADRKCQKEQSAKDRRILTRAEAVFAST